VSSFRNKEGAKDVNSSVSEGSSCFQSFPWQLCHFLFTKRRSETTANEALTDESPNYAFAFHEVITSCSQGSMRNMTALMKHLPMVVI
jgi:hypothetical protein